jgi:hypothetical protein
MSIFRDTVAYSPQDFEVKLARHPDKLLGRQSLFEFPVRHGHSLDVKNWCCGASNLCEVEHR